MTQTQAIPTDYAGTRFRSKSEAHVARAMDRAGIIWEYEPCSIDNYTPDFLVGMTASEHWGDPVIWGLIELKPSKPTDAYFENLAGWYRKHHGELPEHAFFGVITLSPYKMADTPGLGAKMPGADKSGFMGDVLSFFIETLFSRIYNNIDKSYRFDLENQNDTDRRNP